MEIKSLFDKLKQTKQLVSKKKTTRGPPEHPQVQTEGKKITAAPKKKPEKKSAAQPKPKSRPVNSNVGRRTTEEGFKIYMGKSWACRARQPGPQRTAPSTATAASSLRTSLRGLQCFTGRGEKVINYYPVEVYRTHSSQIGVGRHSL